MNCFSIALFEYFRLPTKKHEEVLECMPYSMRRKKDQLTCDQTIGAVSCRYFIIESMSSINWFFSSPERKLRGELIG